MSERAILLKKMEKQAMELGERRFTATESLFPFDGMEDAAPESLHNSVPDVVQGLYLEQGAHFIGRDRYLWLRKTVRVPAAKPGYQPMGFFDFGRTGDSHNSGFESLLFVDRKPFQGVDSNHPEVVFEPFSGMEAELTFMLWSGLEGGGPKREQEHRLRRADIGYLHEDTDQLYHYAKAIAETLEYIHEDSEDRELLTDALEAALARLDWDSGRLHASAGSALEILKGKLTEGKRSRVTVSAVGHSHIDVAWLWRLKHTREKAMRSFSTVLRLMEEFDEYIFFQSQPQLYKYLKKDCPLLYSKIRERVADGRWEPDGGMWLEADCNISSGEALSRQFLYGVRFFEREFGVKATCLWLPDVFGYSWALPQIMNLCNIKTFVTTKISWNQFNTMPDDLFVWRGMDGSEVAAYFIQVPTESAGIDGRPSTYNGDISPFAAIGSWRKFKSKELTNEVLLAFGFGDGGGGPTREMLKMRRVMDGLPGIPNVKTTRVSDYLARQRENMAKAGRPARIWDGELYLECHRGTYTSQGKSKRLNRRLERLLLETEVLAAIASAKGMEYPRGLIDDSWEILLRNQFHDIIPGSSIREVYEDSYREYAEAEEDLTIAVKQAEEALLLQDSGQVTLFSVSSFESKDPIFIETEQSVSFQIDGVPVPSQKCEGGYLIQAPLIPFIPLTVRMLPFETAEASPFRIDIGDRRIETSFYVLEWGEDGCLTRVYDKENNREALSPDGFGNRLEVYEDKPANYDNWDIDFYYATKHEPMVLDGIPLLVEDGPLRAVVRFRYACRNSTIVQDLTVYAKSRRIDFVTKADWHEDHRLLRVHFDTSVRTTKATYDVQYGHIERPNHQNTSWDRAKFEVAAHKWGDLSESNYGVSLLNDCKYGYSALGNTIGLSLLKSGKFPDTEADMGLHEFTYSLLPHAGTMIQGDTIEEAAALNLPVRVMNGAALFSGAPVRTGTNALAVDAVKLAEDSDGIMIRMHECRGGSVAAKLETDLPVSAIQECNILEEPLGPVYSPGEWNTVWRPFEIKTFRLLIAITKTE